VVRFAQARDVALKQRVRPEGVGYAMQPPQVLKDGDVVDIEIEGIGRLSNPVRA
jgi:hypothetical protein